MNVGIVLITWAQQQTDALIKLQVLHSILSPANESYVAEVLSELGGSPLCDITYQRVDTYSQTAMSRQHGTRPVLLLLFNLYNIYPPSFAETCGELRSGTQLKAGLWTPDAPRTEALLPLRRLSEKMKKQTLMTPRMMTPEISALVTVFI